ncbi:hypothetical protein [Rhizobium sp. UGM030330-04]|uniref:hypothetical protein n=1 Tax=Pseudomonadota TaxID=1224 RepID=UPI000BDDA879|nr:MULTISPECIES: hypothetical protein [Pseudomonadota]PYG53423.1 hypothetical protein N434_04918 [Rhizobium sp. UGM030330-04]SNY77986.1 hypothetical protein SAMN02744784_04233 [Stenotrophomonas sp. CC120223-11]
MKNAKDILTVILFSFMLAQPAFAGKLTQTDVDFLFNPTAGYSVSDFTQLTEGELATVEGKVWWGGMWRRIGSAIAGFYRSFRYGNAFQIGRYNYRIHKDPPHHYFKSNSWHGMAGRRKHWQIDRWPIKEGVSKKPIYRLPYGKEDFTRGPPRRLKDPIAQKKYNYKFELRQWRARKAEAQAKGLIDSQGRPISGSSGPSALSASSEETPTEPARIPPGIPDPSAELIQALWDETVASDDGVRPTTLSAENRDSYTGPVPSERLRGLIMQYVAPTRAQACFDFGGLSCD